ncbi:hypothetical protein HMPREF9193_00457 [Treponema lecithinolyticum ATCC 700332]|uniref:Uncharacterized protein n=1 Tax=Treponema lecithinolyticum ATCC 700332 TaxID=1321815 RepID=A0ABN0P0N3_TRELE|nr:hypothetical protein HMPREF9193_00457 [Treponema lecithinolyticum ATCC 700332]
MRFFDTIYILILRYKFFYTLFFLFLYITIKYTVFFTGGKKLARYLQ